MASKAIVLLMLDGVCCRSSSSLETFRMDGRDKGRNKQKEKLCSDVALPTSSDLTVSERKQEPLLLRL